MTEQTEQTPQPGDEWTTWGRQEKDPDAPERWKPSGHVGTVVRLVIRGHKIIPATTYGDWEFIEADVLQVNPDGSVEEFPETELSGAWFIRTFKAAPSGYQALGVITQEQYAKGTGYAMRSLTDAERALVTKAVPTY